MSIYHRHGLTAAKRAAKQLGIAVVSKSTASGRELLEWRDRIISDQGGRENITAGKLALVDEAAVTRYILGVANAWILGQESMLHTRIGRSCST
jgi:hypothetical protein